MRGAYRKIGLVLALLAGMCAPLAAAAGQAADKPENTVKRLYRDYAWQAIGIFDADVATSIQNQSLPELEKYFEPGLARLIRDINECAEKMQGMCIPDFDMIFDSQDPAAADLEISPMDQNNTVRVKFKVPGINETRRINYKMAQTADGWRISDIYYVNTKMRLRDSLIDALKQAKFRQ